MVRQARQERQATQVNLAHVCHRYPPAVGGSEAYFARLSAWLAARGHRVVVFTSTADDLSAFWDRRARQFAPGVTYEHGVEVRRLPLWHWPFAHRYVQKALSLLPMRRWQALTVPFNPVAPGMRNIAERFDAVHAIAFPYSYPLVCAHDLARRLGTPFLLTPFVHTGDPRDPADRIRRAYTTPALLELAREADTVFVQTEGERRVLAAHGVVPERLSLQGLGVDVADCTGGDPAVYRAGANGPILGHLANHSHEKGTIDLLEAANLAWQRGATFELLLAGPRMPAFEAWWATFRPLGRVRLLGRLDATQKRDFFAALDAFVLPSRSDSFGLVLPEAWANSVPVVVYEAGGPPWLVRDGVDGRVVPCGNRGALAEAMQEAIAQREAWGAAGRARIQSDEFSWERSLTVVENALGARRTS
jgi:glycosyltransferase involved in cell wall biosynthesis